MTEETKKIVVNRTKSLAWRAGAFIVVGLCSIVLENVSGFGLSASAITVVSLVLGEITKVLNSRYLN